MTAGKQRETLRRDCVGIGIPSGQPVTLRAGTTVVISQALGDSFTLTTDRGWMVRIAGRDADAIGLEPPSRETVADVPRTAAEVEQQAWERMRHCYDPEIPVNIVDLGLVYGCAAAALPTGEFDVVVQLTLTTPACGMAGVLQADVEDKVESIPGVRRAEVEIVFDPPWDQSRMSEAAKLELGIL